MNVYHSGRTAPVAGIALLVLLMPGTLLRAQEDFQVDAGSAFLYGPVQGQVQTPSGGKPGTTSSGRPTFEELGISTAGAGDFWANVSHGQHGLYAGGRIVRFSAGGTLDATLISQNIAIAAGSPIEAYAKFDWYRVGYRHTLPWVWGDKTIQFYPSIGATLLDFHYMLSSPELETVDRSYAKVGAQVGLGVMWPLTERLSLSGQLLVPIPLSNTPEILSAQVAVQYRFVERDDLSISGMFGIGYDRISYRDGQTVPNDIEADMGPLGMLSLEIRF